LHLKHLRYSGGLYITYLILNNYERVNFADFNKIKIMYFDRYFPLDDFVIEFLNIYLKHGSL